MFWRVLLAALAAAGCIPAQDVPTCPPTPLYSLCDLVFELNEQEAAAHANPYVSVQLQAEFRSPRHRTYLMPGFWDGGRRMVIRFTPVDPGDWDFRVTSNIPRFQGMLGRFSATPSNAPGFIQPANVHHWRWTGSLKGHLWMGDTIYPLATIEQPLFERMIDKRAEQKFNHVRGLVLGPADSPDTAFLQPDRPNPDHFRTLDRRVQSMNAKGMVCDLILGHDQNQLAKLLPLPSQRELYVRYLVARYAAMNITWQGVQEYEEYEDGRALLKELGLLLKRLDPFQHPRSTHTLATSAPLLADGWMTHTVYQSSDDTLGLIERLLYGVPAVNAEFAYEDSGAGRSLPHHVDSDTFRRRLWNATMNGQYPTLGNTGTYGGSKFPLDPKFLDSPGARQMAAWFDFFSRTRFWELQPYFEVDGGRALALDDVEYIVYVEKPSGPVELLVARHSYQVSWFNPVTGEFLKQKDFKGDKFVAEPPNTLQDWVLHLERRGRKEGMLTSYKFESRPTLLQEVESSPQRVPFEIAEPSAEELSVSRPASFAVQLRRETRATRTMRYLWIGEAPAEGLGARFLASGKQGTLRVPPGMARNYPAVLSLRVYGLNANGKLYATDRIYRLVP